MRRSSDTMLRESRIAMLQTLSTIVISLIFRKNLILDACILIALFWSLYKTNDHADEDGNEYRLKHREFRLFR